MTELIFDRTADDVRQKNKKGLYGAEDLNRVETAVGQLQQQLQSLGIGLQLQVKTDWQFTDRFSPNSWPTKEQMQRYLSNVAQICQNCGVEAYLPQTMEYLTWEGANRIEEALYRAQLQVAAMKLQTTGGEEESIL